jgi:putative redox protein
MDSFELFNPGMTVNYSGELRCEATHHRSGNTLITDAPPDNHGKGEAFSPTDLLCTSLACCMISLLGIVANEKEIKLGKIESKLEKVMASNPRRVSTIRIQLTLEDTGYTERERSILENTARTCPVALSLHPDIQQELQFNYVK